MSTPRILEQDTRVAEYLKSINVGYKPVFLAEMIHDEWKHDLFNVMFSRVGKSVFSTEFKTGTGHRVMSKRSYNSVVVDYAKALRVNLGFAGNDKVKETAKIKASITRQQAYDNDQYIFLPTAASVLYCLLLDRQVIEYGFSEWCDNFGYSNDSLEALNMYRACEDIAKGINSIFKGEEIEHLRELLEDY